MTGRGIAWPRVRAARAVGSKAAGHSGPYYWVITQSRR
jgi:hypothetical protein